LKPSLLSIKKPCHFFYRSCKDSLQGSGFGKAHDDVQRIPAKFLSFLGKVVFYALARESRGTNRTVWISDGDLALRCGASRPSVLYALRKLVAIGLIEKSGEPVHQIQGYRILHAAFKAAKSDVGNIVEPPAKKPQVICPQCQKPRTAITKTGTCKACNAVNRTERIARRVSREEIQAAGIDNVRRPA
jgi:hypothetical protein